MDLNERTKLLNLLDLYGPLLTIKQQEIVRDHLALDLSFQEIGEAKNLTRSAIQDSFKKATDKLLKYEDKLHFLEKLHGKHIDI